MSALRVSIILLGLFILVGCTLPESTIKNSFLPTGSTNVKNVGNGWFTFEYEGKKFLYFRHGAGDSTHSGVTKISE